MTRVVSLLPAGTEIVAALGAGNLLVGVSHACDWPPWVTRLPRVTTTPVDAGAASARIDRQVRALMAQGRPVIAVDAGQLAALQPDLIVTQGLCEVCAATEGDLRPLAAARDPLPRVLSLGARDLEGILADITTVAEALDLASEGEELVAGLRYRIRRLAAAAPARRPRVLCVEWLEPLFLAGHWVPDLVGAAGGVDVGASPGNHSVPTTWERLADRQPDLVIVMLCGFGLDRALAELAAHPLPPLGVPVWVLDGDAYTARPGPRVVDGAGLIQSALLGREAPGLVRAA